MEARITFRSEVFIKGDSLKEIRSKFEELPLFKNLEYEGVDADFVELTSVEDADTYEDLMSEYRNAYK